MAVDIAQTRDHGTNIMDYQWHELLSRTHPPSRWLRTIGSEVEVHMYMYDDQVAPFYGTHSPLKWVHMAPYWLTSRLEATYLMIMSNSLDETAWKT